MCAQRGLNSAYASTQSDQSSHGTLWVAKDSKRLQADSGQPAQRAMSLINPAEVQADLSLRWAHMQSCRK